MSRHEFKFPYPASTLLKAATAKLEHHISRRDFWDAERKNAEQELREHGIEFRPRATTSSTYVGNSVVLDREREANLDRCVSRFRHHASTVEEFEAFVAGFGSAGPDTIYNLRADDIRYFGIVGPIDSDEEDE